MPRRTLSEDCLLVFTAEWAGTGCVVKYPRTERASASLAREWDRLRELAADPRLAPWRALLPEAVGSRPSPPGRGARTGTADGPTTTGAADSPANGTTGTADSTAAGAVAETPDRPADGPETGAADGPPGAPPRRRPLVQTLLPGVPAGPLLPERPQEVRRTTTAALGLLAALRAATGRPEPAADHLSDWAHEQLDVLAAELGRGRPEAGAGALDPLRRRLDRALAGATLTRGWTHGDFHSGNLLLDEGRTRITGVFDWGNSRADGPAEIDACTFVLATREALGGPPMGRQVAEVLRRGRLPSADRALLAAHGVGADGPGQGGGEDPVALPLLTWLWHVSGNLRKTPWFGRSRRWLGVTVTPVLREAARGPETP
ncbi:phosphotransferase family protein [Streptomyces sp. NPDC088090]|uniref:phosphotransferase family protein n=1 Tax=Streptomyces sp. NPDC088090 TaxID=3365822 RepID=UPI00384E3E28